MERLLKRTLGCILPTTTIRDAAHDFSSLKLNASQQLDDEELNLGVQMQLFIEKHKEDGSLPAEDVQIFYRLAIKFKNKGTVKLWILL